MEAMKEISPDALRQLRSAFALALGWLDADESEESAPIKRAVANGWDKVTDLLGDDQYAPAPKVIRLG